jgi:hypothetical protein
MPMHPPTVAADSAGVERRCCPPGGPPGDGGRRAGDGGVLADRELGQTDGVDPRELQTVSTVVTRGRIDSVSKGCKVSAWKFGGRCCLFDDIRRFILKTEICSSLLGN